MNNHFKITDKIGDIVTQFPGASDIFYQHQIDFCCGGNRPLAEAVELQHLDVTSLVEELNVKYNEFAEKNKEYMDWAKESPGKLIDFIVSTHHAYLKEELPRISEYLFKILKVHGTTHEELFRVHRLYNNLRTELEGHLVKEEEFLFPLVKQLKETHNPDIRERQLKLIADLESEHTGAGDILKELREITDHYQVPEGACKTFEITYEKLKELELDLFQHIHLENNILFLNQHTN